MKDCTVGKLKTDNPENVAKFQNPEIHKSPNLTKQFATYHYLINAEIS